MYRPPLQALIQGTTDDDKEANQPDLPYTSLLEILSEAQLLVLPGMKDSRMPNGF
jgi:hypothetical protein